MSDGEMTGATSTASTSPGEGAPPATPVLTLGFSPIKQFEFTWSATAGAVHHRLMESPWPDAAYQPLGEEITGESRSWTMPLHLRHAASYILRACNDDGCTDSAAVDVVDSLAHAVGYFKASNTTSEDRFGDSVALSRDGSTLAIGAFGEDSDAIGIDGDESDNSRYNAGAVYVFKRDGNTWSREAYIKASNTGDDHFGDCLALSDDGDTLAVGADSEDSIAIGIEGDQADDSAANAGAAYVFVRVGSTWSQEAYIKASNTDAQARFGTSIALSGDGKTLAVGAYFEDGAAVSINGDQQDDTKPDSGAVYVFARGLMQWEQEAYVKAANSDPYDGFGYAVALSDDGDTLAVGASYERSNATGVDGDDTDNSATDAGAVYVFRRAQAMWSQKAYIKASNTFAFDAFGRNVALSGDGATLAVGAHGEDSAATDIGGDESDNSMSSSGAVYVFVQDAREGKWSQEAYIKPFNTDEQDSFGTSVSLSDDGKLLAVGAYGESSAAVGVEGDSSDNSAMYAGAVYVFKRDRQAWSQAAYVKAPNPEADDRFGLSVALSGDGQTLGVGSNEDSADINIGGDQSNNSAADAGAVYVY